MEVWLTDWVLKAIYQDNVMVGIYNDGLLKLSIFRFPSHAPYLNFKIRTYLGGDVTQVSSVLDNINRKARSFDEEMVQGEVRLSRGRKTLELTYSLDIDSPEMKDLKKGAKKLVEIYRSLIQQFGSENDINIAEERYASLLGACNKIDPELPSELVGNMMPLKCVVPLSPKDIEKLVNEYRKKQKVHDKG